MKMPRHSNAAVKNPASRLLPGYKTVDGTPDELMGPAGEIRPVWSKIISAIDAMQPQELAQRTTPGDTNVPDAGGFPRCVI